MQITIRSQASGRARRKIACRLDFCRSSQKLGPIVPKMLAQAPNKRPNFSGTSPRLPTINPTKVGVMISTILTPRKMNMACGL